MYSLAAVLDSGHILTWCLVLVGTLVAAFLAVAFIRRQYFRDDDFPRQGFTIADLRRLRDSGQMSAEEFERAKTALLGRPTDENPPPPNSGVR